MKRSQLLLAPVTPTHSRIWMPLPRGAVASETVECALQRFPAHWSRNFKPLIVASEKEDLVTYACAASVLEQLQEKLRACGSPLIPASVIDAMRDARAAEVDLNSSDNLEDAVRHNGDALAALRRISRESAESSSLIDRAARHLNASASSLGLTHIVIVNAERIDRPSLKVFARACLLAPQDTAPVWIWMAVAQTPDCVSQTFEARSNLPAHARCGILDAIKTVLVPQETENSANHYPVIAPASRHKLSFGIGEATGQLTNLNYDRCAQWVASGLDSGVDTHRLAALLMVNLGLPEAAIDTLTYAIAKCPDTSLQCHMWYVAGLVWSKRLYNVAQSNRCFDQAEASLESAGFGESGDSAMERAWVQNGRAMNAILTARFSGHPIKDAFPVAFDYLRKAFDLVKEGQTRDRVYLRYNLLGNMSSLMEIGGNYEVALDLVNRTFDESLAHGNKNERDWLAQQRCMRASLMARAGDYAAAVPVFHDARSLMLKTDRPIWAEALGRSEATARFQSGHFNDAGRVYATCLDEARTLRSRLGVETHVAGLAACHVATGRTADAISVLQRIGEEEDVWVVDQQALERNDLTGLHIRDTYYGLSLSIPEVDLEEMAPASIAGALRGRKSEVATAKALAQ